MNTISKRMFLLLTALGSIALLNTAVADEECDNQAMIGVDPNISGSANLCLTPGGLKAQMNAKGLTAGNAYTVWWVYFDDPSQCVVEGECGEADLGGDNPLGVFGRFDSAIGPRNGNVHFSDAVPGMQPSGGAQIWILILDHGEAMYADGRRLARQLLTPEDPAAGAPHLGNHTDGAQFSVAALTVHQVD